jgi:glycosyltransferase involved in cell wall biosynthesis
MGAGNCVIAKDTPENHEVLGDTGLFFRAAEDLALQIELALSDRSLLEHLGAGARNRARAHYSWDAVTDAYEKLFRDLVISD